MRCRLSSSVSTTRIGASVFLIVLVDLFAMGVLSDRAHPAATFHPSARELDDSVDDVLEDYALGELAAEGFELGAGELRGLGCEGDVTFEGAIGDREALGGRGERGGRVALRLRDELIDNERRHA